MAEMQTSAGGIHPGKPIIWPNLKSQQTQTQTTQQDATQTQQQSSTSSATQTTQSTTNATPAQAVQNASTTTAATATASASSSSTAPVVRELTINDVTSHLASINLPATEANVKLASLMLRFGVELSRENFIKALGMIEGSNKSTSTQEAALVLLSKGITNSSEAVRMLSNQLSETPNITGQLSSIKAALAQLSASIPMNPTMFSPTMLAQITALVSQFSAIIDDLPKKYKFGSEGSAAIGRDDLINDVRALSSLLDGIQSNAISKESMATPENEAVRSGIISASKKMGDLLDNLLSQSLLSQRSAKSSLGQEDYLYYQIPNNLFTPPSSVEIIVKQDQSKRNTVDLDDTHIAIGLETEALGKMVVSVIVKDKNVKMLFNTEVDETKRLCDQESINLKKNLSEKGYNVEECQARVNKSMCSIKPFLIPLLGLERLFRIDNTV